MQGTASCQNMFPVPILAGTELGHCRMSWYREVGIGYFQTDFAPNCSHVLLILGIYKAIERQLVVCLLQ